MISSTRRKAGFTLIELLIVVAIIGIIAAMLIPNLIDAMNKAKQKRTVADMHMTGTAMMSWLTDQASAAAAGAGGTLAMSEYASIDYTDLIEVLNPEYIQAISPIDGWKTSYDYYLNITDPFAAAVMAMRSPGRNKVTSGETYTAGSFDPTDYDQDILWADGYFVRWPEGRR